jgi:hypothetical protein
MKAREPQPDTEPAYCLSLRIRHPSIDPAELSRAFALEPLHAFRAGDLRAARQGSGSTRHAASYWLVDLVPGLSTAIAFEPSFSDAIGVSQTARQRLGDMAAGNPGLALSLIVTQVLKARADLLTRLVAEGGDVTLLVELSTQTLQGFSLAPQTLRALADLAVTVNVEFAEV